MTRLLARMFSPQDSRLATENKPLWLCFLGRYHSEKKEPLKCTNSDTSTHEHYFFPIFHDPFSFSVLLICTSRFNDVSPSVRVECIRYSKYFLVYHAHLAGEVAQHLHERFHDREEKVRMESVTVVSEAAADNLKAVPQSVSGVSYGGHSGIPI